MGRRLWHSGRNIAVRIERDHISVLAAGIAFYLFVAIPSSLTTIVSLYGLIFNPADVEQQVAAMHGLLPSDVIDLVSGFLKSIAAHSGEGLGWGLALSLFAAIWSAQSAASAMIAALNAVNETTESRSLASFYAASFAVAGGAIIFALGAVTLLAVLPPLLDLLYLADTTRLATRVARWPVLLLLLASGIAGIYRFAPARPPKDKWGRPGLAVATLLWTVSSVLFSLYVEDFSSYDRSYGPLGAIVVLLLWLYLSTYALLLGAEVNVEWGLRPEKG